jgi:hypothetical protein
MAQKMEMVCCEAQIFNLQRFHVKKGLLMAEPPIGAFDMSRLRWPDLEHILLFRPDAETG